MKSILKNVFSTFAFDISVKGGYMFKIGIDIGSTTVKIVALDKDEQLVFYRYKRHHARAREEMLNILRDYPSTAACAAAKRAIGTRKGEQLT